MKPRPVYNSRLRAKPERPDPTKLHANAGCSYNGSYLMGTGFTLTPEERNELVTLTPKNAERIFPCLGGAEVNTSPTHSPHRYVINFGEMSLEEAERWPDLLEIVRMKVKPERDKLRDNPDGRHPKAYWWQPVRTRPALYRALKPLSRCLVTAQVTKHLCFSFQPTGRIYSQQLYVFPLEAFTAFAVLQSRLHSVWTRLLSTTMKTDLSYSAPDCFETFPFPEPDPRTVLPKLESIGKRLYEARAAYMLDTHQGLTKTYNKLKDADYAEPDIVELRELHRQIDRAVLDAYGWSDIEVPPYGVESEHFKDEVIDRLHALNAERAHGQA